MLTKNIWQSQGLYNGALGIVRGLVFTGNLVPPNQPSCILIEFDEYNGPSAVTNSDRPIIPIVPISADIDEGKGSGKTGTRSQFPLVLGWAMTIHKSQGLTLDKVVLGLGSLEISVGLSYVGCSRVQSWQNLVFDYSFPWSRMEKINNHAGLVNIRAEINRLIRLQGVETGDSHINELL
jgi:ATP-dependent DNA helicase PIF1